MRETGLSIRDDQMDALDDREVTTSRSERARWLLDCGLAFEQVAAEYGLEFSDRREVEMYLRKLIASDPEVSDG